MCELAPALSPHFPSPWTALRVEGGAAGLAVPRMPARGAVLSQINTQATLGEFLIGIWGMQRLQFQAAGLFLVLSTNSVPPPH